jgi:phosphate transport system substrate-binding protein
VGVRGYGQSRDVIAAVAEDPLALGFAALNRSEPRVRALAISPRPGRTAVAATPATLQAGRYPLDRWLWLYVRQDGQGRLEPLARAYLAFALSVAGQRIVGSGTLGYLPLGSAELRRERAKLG